MGPEFAVPLLQRMREVNIPPDMPTYSKLLDVCSRAAAHRKAGIEDVGRIFAQMTLDHLTPNTMTLNAMLKVRLSAQSSYYRWIDLPFYFLAKSIAYAFEFSSGLCAPRQPRRCLHTGWLRNVSMVPGFWDHVIGTSHDSGPGSRHWRWRS